MTGPRKLAFVLCGCLLGCARQGASPPAADQRSTIAGQVFIATRGAETFRLALVDVYVLEGSTAEGFQTRAADRGRRIDAFQREYDGAKRAAAVTRAEADRGYIAYQKSVASHAGKSATLARMGTWQDAEDTAGKASHQYGELKAKFRETCAIDNYFLDPSALAPVAKITTDADGRFSLKVKSGRGYILVASASRQVLSLMEHYFWAIHVAADEPTVAVALTNRNLMEVNPPDRVVTVTACTP